MELAFRFYGTNQHFLTNNTAYNVRRLVAEYFAVCGFGEVVEREENKFSNREIEPVIDVYIAEDSCLQIVFSFNPFLTRGDLRELLQVRLPQFFDECTNMNVFCEIEMHSSNGEFIEMRDPNEHQQQQEEEQILVEIPAPPPPPFVQGVLEFPEDVQFEHEYLPDENEVEDEREFINRMELFQDIYGIEVTLNNININ